jgi:hypothetical protein
MKCISKQVVLTAIGFLIFSFILLFSGVHDTASKLKAHFFGEITEVIATEFRYLDYQKRTKSQGPELNVYLTNSENLDLRLISLEKLNLGDVVTCTIYYNHCYHTEENDVFPYIPIIKLVNFGLSFMFLIMGIFTLIFRHQITEKVQSNQKVT